MSFLQIAEPGETSGKSACYQRVIGIDLGTTHSLVASVVDGTPQCFPDSNGEVLLPSVVQYRLGTSPLVGKVALQAMALSPVDTIVSVKRFMGRSLRDISLEVQQRYQFIPDEKTIRFQVLSQTIGQPDHLSSKQPAAQKPGREVTPVEVSAEILKVLRRRAETVLGGEIEGAVITVPAYFDEAQRQATKDAARLAGLPVLRLINEPTAAALAYGLDKKSQGIFAVYDLGGGTFDISILELKDGVFGVLSTSGDTALGGDDMDRELAHFLMEHHPRSQELKDALQQSPALWSELLLVCRQLKHELTSQNEVMFRGIGPFPAQILITESQFSQLIQSLLERTSVSCRRAFKDAQLLPNQIDGVILVGGATRVPSVRRHVTQLFGKEPLVDVDPDQVVALGAAIQAEIIANQREDVLLLDVTPLSLGLGLMGGLVEKIIPRNSRIPTAAQQVFTTYADGQTGFDLHVVQGERDRVEDCRSLARFQLTGIPKMAAGMPRLEILFLVDENGLLQVTATELTSGKEARIQVEPSYGLTEEQVEQMLLDSYEHAEADVAYRSVTEQRVEAQSMITILQKALQIDAALLSLEEKEQIEKALIHTNQVLQGTSSKAIVEALKELEKVSQDFMERRMNQSIQTVVTGHTVSEIENQLPSETLPKRI